MECRETVVVSPLALTFEALRLDDDNLASKAHLRSRSQSQGEKLEQHPRSSSWGPLRCKDDSATKSPPHPVIKIGSGELHCAKRIKKNRPSIQKKNIEMLITKRFNEEEAELATLCMDFAGELERREKKDTEQPRCPAPDPSMMRRPEKEPRDRRLEGLNLHPFGLRPRNKRTKKSFLPPNFDALEEDEAEELENEKEEEPAESNKPTIPALAMHQIKKPPSSLRRAASMDTGLTSIAIPALDFGKLSLLRSSAGPLVSPRPSSPPRSPSAPGNVSKPDLTNYNRIEGSPRSAFVRPSFY